MKTRALLLVTGLLALCLILPACSRGGEAALEPQVSTERATYPIQGSTAEELRAQLDQLGPLDQFSQRHDMYTRWEVRWSYLPWPWGGECSLKRPRATVTVTFTFPEWHPPEGASPELVDRWVKYMEVAQVHEDGHQKIAVDAARAVLDALVELPPASACAGLEEAADQAGAEILESYRQKEIEYDRKTGHGATQGAIFP
jgi:predicted secreted Zn-dependent protease